MTPPGNGAQLDKAGRGYWDGRWQDVNAGGNVSRFRALREYREQVQRGYFERMFAGRDTRDRLMLEVGCANSQWLPYFAKTYGLQVFGMDYSEQGCNLAQRALSAQGVKGEIVFADLFEPPRNLLQRFDFVASFGLVEHFEKPSHCISSLAKFLKPNGILFTSVPNLVGAVGWAQRILGPATWRVHKPISKNTLIANLSEAGLQVIDCRYIQLHDFAINIVDPTPNRLLLATRKMIYEALKRVTAAAILAKSALGMYPVNRLTSSYVYSLAKKPAD